MVNAIVNIFNVFMSVVDSELKVAREYCGDISKGTNADRFVNVRCRYTFIAYVANLLGIELCTSSAIQIGVYSI